MPVFAPRGNPLFFWGMKANDPNRTREKSRNSGKVTARPNLPGPRGATQTGPFELSDKDKAMTVQQYDDLIRRLKEGGN